MTTHQSVCKVLNYSAEELCLLMSKWIKQIRVSKDLKEAKFSSLDSRLEREKAPQAYITQKQQFLRYFKIQMVTQINQSCRLMKYSIRAIRFKDLRILSEAKKILVLLILQEASNIARAIDSKWISQRVWVSPISWQQVKGTFHTTLKCYGNSNSNSKCLCHRK